MVQKKKRARLDDDGSRTDTDHEDSNNWCNLPSEIWLTILHHLTPGDLCSVSLTCHTLMSLSRDPGLWSQVTIDWQSIKNKTQSVESLLTRTSRLTQLTITNRTFEQVNSPLIMTSIKRARESVRELVLSPEIALGNTALARVSSLTQLTSLELAGDWIKTSGTAAISQLTLLERLKMPGAEQVTAKDMRDMFSALTKLRLIDVSECKKGVTDMSVIALVTSNPGLEYLALDECELVTGKSMKSVAEKCPGLQHLSLYGCYQVNDPAMMKVATHCTRLTYLSLGLCSTVKDSSLTKLGQHCPGLSFLNLFGCAYLSERGVEKYVKTATNLKHLDIRGILGMSQTFSERLERDHPHIDIVHQFRAKPPRAPRSRTRT